MKKPGKCYDDYPPDWYVPRKDRLNQCISAATLAFALHASIAGCFCVLSELKPYLIVLAVISGIVGFADLLTGIKWSDHTKGYAVCMWLVTILVTLIGICLVPPAIGLILLGLLLLEITIIIICIIKAGRQKKRILHDSISARTRAKQQQREHEHQETLDRNLQTARERKNHLKK